ncbi:MAG: hypothetical protein JF606_19195, partial [Burkholderiales bacterium]|nr:hypothetical protein [Burkholderiales bacterium]
MSGDQIQRRATAPLPTATTAPMPDECINPSSHTRPSLNPPSGMQELGRAPQSSGASTSRVEEHHTPAPTLTRPSIDSRSPTSPSSAPLVRNLQTEIDAAVAHSKRYQEYIERTYPKKAFQRPNLLVARASLQAMEAAQRGLDALAASSARAQRANLAARELLEEERFNGAMRFLALRDDSQLSDVVVDGLDRDADMETLVVKRAAFEKALVEGRQLLGQTLAAREVMKLGGWTISAEISNETNRLSLLCQAFEWDEIMSLTTNRLLTHAKELSPSLIDALDVLIGIIFANQDAYSAAESLLTCSQVDQQTLPAALEAMEHIRSQIDGAAQQLCLVASRELESDAPTWKMALECADAARGFSLAMAETMKRARNAPAEPGSRASASTGPASADPSAGRMVASPAGDGMSGGGRKRSGRKGKQRPLRTESQVSAKGVSAPADGARLALDSALLALARSRPVTLQMAGDDPVEVARVLGQSTDTIDLFRRHHVDPMHIAGTVRSFLPKWFGDIKQLRAASVELAALPSEKRSDPDVKRLGAQLTERISVLEAMPDKVTAREIEDIKQYQFPKEKHLERLLDLGEIARV